MAQRVVAWTAHETPARPITAEYVHTLVGKVRLGASIRTSDIVLGVLVPLSAALEEANRVIDEAAAAEADESDDPPWQRVSVESAWRRRASAEGAIPVTEENFRAWAAGEYVGDPSSACPTCVYAIMHDVDGCVYVGTTAKAPSTRWLEHCLDAEYGDPRAIHRYIRRNPMECYMEYRGHGRGREDGGEGEGEGGDARVVFHERETPFPRDAAIRLGKCAGCDAAGPALRPTCVGLVPFGTDLDPRHARHVGDWALLCPSCALATGAKAWWSAFEAPLYKRAWFWSSVASERVATESALAALLT